MPSLMQNLCVCRKNMCPENRGGVGAVCARHMQIDNPVREDIYQQLDLWAGGSCCGTAPSSPAITVSGAGPGSARARGAGRGCRCSCNVPGRLHSRRGPSKQPPTFSQTPWGSCLFLGLSPPIFEMELGSRVHQALFSSDISTLQNLSAQIQRD